MNDSHREEYQGRGSTRASPRRLIGFYWFRLVSVHCSCGAGSVGGSAGGSGTWADGT